MNSYSQKVKCQNQTDGSHVHKSQKNNARMMRVSKKTNTPPEFFVCQQCQQIMGKKLNPVPIQMTVGDCGVGFNEYTKALNYINSCHTIINKMITRIQDSDSQTSQILSMPDLPNFIDLFSSIHNIKQNLTEREANSQNCNNAPETPKSDEEICESVEDSDDKAERQSLEEQKTTYKREEYLFLNPKQNDEQKVECDDNYSAPTTENEDSEAELDLSQQQPLISNKFKPVTLQNKREKVIYEEINSHDEDSRCNLQSKQNNTVETCPKQNLNPEFSTTRAKKNSNIPERIKNPVPNIPRSQEVNYLTVSTNTTHSTQRKIKPRSASAKPNNYISPGEKKKDCIELSPNYSDTALSIKNTTKSNNKVQEKSLIQPIRLSLGPNSALSQRDLDKYAKELLGSGSLSPRSNSPDSRNFSPKQTTRPKTEERSKMHVSKTTGNSSKSKQVDVKKRPKSHQERQAHPSRYQPVQTQTVVMQQNGSKRHKNCFPAVSLHKAMAEGQQTDEQLLRNTPKQHNLGLTRSHNPTYLHSSTVTNLHSSTKTNLSVSPTIVCPTQSMKISHEDDSHSTQQKYRRVKMRGPLTHTESSSETKSPNKVQETPQNMAQMNHHMIMSRRMCPAGPINNNPEVKTQFSVTVKPNDFFTINRKTSSHHQRKLTKSNHVYNNAEEMNVESDDIKTDSDLDDDHFNNEEADKKSTSSLHIKKVLSNLGLFPNGQVNPETEHLKMEAKSTRANDERNRPFREPRKTIPDPETPEMVRISDEAQQDVYQASSVTNLGRTQSEESSDIKSDNEDDYLRIRTVSYNCYSANRYHQT